jgi:hypothetical protein
MRSGMHSRAPPTGAAGLHRSRCILPTNELSQQMLWPLSQFGVTFLRGHGRTERANGHLRCGPRGLTREEKGRRNMP